MSDELTYKELESLLKQLQGQDLESIGQRLGLDLHPSDKQVKDRLRQQLDKDPALLDKARELALSLSARATCSFCGSDQETVIRSPNGASICRACLARMRQ